MAFKKKFAPRRKFCRFCADKELPLNYKRPDILRDFITERGKIIARRITHLRPSPAPADPRNQTRPPDGSAHLHRHARLRRQEKEHDLRGAHMKLILRADVENLAISAMCQRQARLRPQLPVAARLGHGGQ